MPRKADQMIVEMVERPLDQIEWKMWVEPKASRTKSFRYEPMHDPNLKHYWERKRTQRSPLVDVALLQRPISPQRREGTQPGARQEVPSGSGRLAAQHTTIRQR